METYLCDQCTEMEARTYSDDLGAICYDCREQYVIDRQAMVAASLREWSLQ